MNTYEEYDKIYDMYIIKYFGNSIYGNTIYDNSLSMITLSTIILEVNSKFLLRRMSPTH